jgi:hypothetical protein
MKKYNLYPINYFIIILLFVIGIYSPLITGLLQNDKKISQIEQRNLNSLPSIPNNITELIAYPQNFNRYYADHFGFRDQLTQHYFSYLNQFSDPTSLLNEVTMGQNDWLFLGSIKPGIRRFDDPMGDAIHLNLFTSSELKKFAQSLTTIKNWLANQGIQYIYMIAPNKHSIYFEQLPKYITKKNPLSATDQLVNYLKIHTDVTVLDLRNTLLKQKHNNYQLYYKNDSHWNFYGANFAQFEIMKKIQQWFPNSITPVLLMDNQFDLVTKSTGDLSRFAKIEGTIFEEEPLPNFIKSCHPFSDPVKDKNTQVVTMICRDQTLNAVIFRDSFFMALTPYIARYFHRSTYIWEPMNYQSLSKYIEQEKPNIVIDEVIERSLPYIPSIQGFPK